MRLGRTRRLLIAAGCVLPFAVGAAAPSISEGTVAGDVLTIPVNLSAADTVDVYVGIAGPRDGDPAALQSAAKTVELPAGDSTVQVQISVGAKVAYSIRTADGASETKTVTVEDNSEYVWVDNAKGDWHDPQNWRRVKSDPDGNAYDGYMNIGYPAYCKGFIRFNGNQTAEVRVDADYSGLGEIFVDNPHLNLTIRSSGKTLEFGNAHCTSDNSITLDGVRFITRGSYTVHDRSKLRMVNGAYFQTNWEFNVSGEDAYLYVGPGCEVYASSGWWWTFRLDGEGALVEIDDGYIHSRGFRFASQRQNVAPAGVVFRGANPRFEFEEEFVGCSANLPKPVVFEYFVPVGGYAQAPFRKKRDGNYRALDNRWADHANSTDFFNSPVKFSVCKDSPFYQGEAAGEVCLFDWSATAQGVKNSQIMLAATDTPETDWLEMRDGNADGENDQVWAHLTGTGIPADLPAIATATSAQIDDATGKVTLNGEMVKLADGLETQVGVYVAEGGPVDEPLAEKLVRVATLPVADTGAFSYEFAGTKGAKIAYRFVCEAVNAALEKTWECGSSQTASIIYRDDQSRRWEWINGEEGCWSDKTKWRLSGEEDGRKRLGYPAWGSAIGFYSGRNVVHVDADYAEIREMILGWSGAEIVFDNRNSDGAQAEKVYTVEVSGFRDGQYDNTHVTLDGVAFDTLGTTYPNSYHCWNGSTLKLLNGARLRAKWEVVAEGENAYIYVGTNCSVFVSKAEPYHRLGLAGTGAKIVIDGGTVETVKLVVGQGKEGAPAGIVFSGSNPQLRTGDCEALSGCTGSPVFSFAVPAGGFASAPFVHSPKDSAPNTFMHRETDTVPPVKIELSPDSPAFKTTGRTFVQQLVDWSSDASAADAPPVDPATVELLPVDGPSRAALFFTPETQETKDGIAAVVSGRDGTVILIR